MATNLVVYTAKAVGTTGAGTNYYPSSAGFDLNMVEQPGSFAVHYTDAGDATSTNDLSLEVYDGTNWMTDSTLTFTQVTTVAKKFVKVLAPTLWGMKVRAKLVTAAATSGANGIKFIYSAPAGAYTV